MGRHEAGADNRFAITNGWIDRWYGKDTLLEETLGKGKGFGFAANENGNNGTLGGPNLETDRLETLVHLAGILPEHLDALRFGLHDLESFENTTSHRWSE